MTFSTRENVALFSQIQIFFKGLGCPSRAVEGQQPKCIHFGFGQTKSGYTLVCWYSKFCTRSVLTRPICTTIYSKLFGASKSKFTSKDLSGNFVDSSRAALSVQTYTRELRNYFGFLHRITSLGSSQQLRASLTRSSCTRMC